MAGTRKVDVAADFDWRQWVGRWDRMQDRYVPGRAERMELMVRLIRQMQGSPNRILDLGCGSGSLTLALLEAFGQAQVVGVDYDPTLLYLAERRLTEFQGRTTLIQADLRDPSWTDGLPAPVEAAVSATALHWLAADELAALYKQLASRLAPGGIFLNADHVGSECPAVQKFWEQQRWQMLSRSEHSGVDDWTGFWEAFGKALGMDTGKLRQELAGPWRGVEEGLPLAWHFDRLRAAGFAGLDCFWRLAGDAVYGGIRR